MVPDTLCSRRRTVALLVLGIGLLAASEAADAARVIPPPAMDEPAAQAGPEVAVLAGGCFWGVQGVFQHVDGVISAVAGYAGGTQATAQYETVSSGTTGHAESARVTFDPHRISYGTILQIFFSVVHNPTELNFQGPDHGPQYRSAIFPINPEQIRIAKAYIAQLDAAHVFPEPLVTRIETGRAFYPAEAYHQDFLARNPDDPYIVYWDLQKIRDLRQFFPQLYRADPVLVASAGKPTP